MAVVTGAGSGIGRAIALALVREGAVVHGVGRRGSALAESAARAAGGPGTFEARRTDLSDTAALQALAASVRSRRPGIDILVHAAGVIEPGRVEEVTPESLDRHYVVNIRAPMVLTRALLPALLEQRGQIVFINSSAGLQASAGIGSYAASKHAMRAVADALRAEVNERGVRVLTVYVGRTATPMQARLHRLEGRPYHPKRLAQPTDVATMVVAALALPRTAEVTDLAVRPMRPPS